MTSYQAHFLLRRMSSAIFCFSYFAFPLVLLLSLRKFWSVKGKLHRNAMALMVGIYYHGFYYRFTHKSIVVVFDIKICTNNSGMHKDLQIRFDTGMMEVNFKKVIRWISKLRSIHISIFPESFWRDSCMITMYEVDARHKPLQKGVARHVLWLLHYEWFCLGRIAKYGVYCTTRTKLGWRIGNLLQPTAKDLTGFYSWKC